jgi:DNA repair protein RadD
MLRNYQSRAISQLYDWFRANKGNPCLVMPTGSGKSHIVAALCKDALQQWPQTRILMLTHVKELIEQNAQKMRQHWANAPMGIYSASIGKRQIDAITFAGIQSIRSKAAKLGHIDLCIIDECHLVSHRDEGSYRKLINDLKDINPALRVIGLTATPYRLGHGLITDGEALFDDLIEPVSIEELIYLGHLAPLRSKVTTLDFDLSKVHKRGGEYIESELQEVMNDKDKNIKVVREILALAGERKAWLLFCSGVDHSHQMAQVLNAYNVPAACITGDTPKAERERLIADFKAGHIRALTNANVLTTGFDYPDIDLISMVRPTMSASLYVQMAGRGMRPKSHTDHCLVLDFAGVVAQHGPITAVQPPSKAGSGDGEAPVRVCDECHEICHASVKVCPACGREFPPPPEKEYALHTDDIMGLSATEMTVTGWRWRKHTSRTSGKDMLAVSYYGTLSDPSVTEYYTITHDGYAGQKALQRLAEVARKSGVLEMGLMKSGKNTVTLDDMALNMNQAKPPKLIKYVRKGKFNEVLEREW